MLHATPKLLLPKDYIDEVTNCAKKAQARIYLTSLTLFEDGATQPLIDALITAAKRGVDVHVMADFMTFMYAEQHTRNIYKFLTGVTSRKSDRIRKQLTEAGAKFSWLGCYNVPLCIGRTHSKWCVIDDTVFAFGGVNTEGVAVTKQADYMFSIIDSKLATKLATEQLNIEAINQNPKHRINKSIILPYGTALIDSGKMNRSLIYSRALQLAKQAKHITLVSQYCPSGKLGKEIASKPAEVYFNRKSLADSKLNKILIGSSKLVASMHNLYTRDRYIHAKFAIFTMPDGKKVAITGSHNFTTAGSFFGTREIALETTNSKIISQLEHFLETEIK